MIHLIPGIKGAALMGAAVAGGGLVTALAETIGDSTTVQISVVGGLVIGVFYAGATLQKLKDGQKATNARLSRIERKLKISAKDDDDEE